MQQSVRNVFAKFKVDRLSRVCTGARQGFTTWKPFPSEIPLTIKTATSSSDQINIWNFFWNLWRQTSLCSGKKLTNLFENTHNMSGAGLQHGTYLTPISYTLETPIFRNTWGCFLFICYCNVSSKDLLFISLFLQKIRRPVPVSYKLVTFVSNW